MERNPKVSVIMPAYNSEKYIGTAIESILNQTYKDFEFIIVNDCSTDNTLQTIQSYSKKDRRIKVIDSKVNLKVGKAGNKALQEAKGDYIVRLDSDDWSYPERIEKQVKYMDEHPDIVLSSGNMEICDEKLNVKNRSNLPTQPEEIMRVLLQYNPTVHSAMIYKRKEALELGGYSLDAAEDYMLVIDMSSKGKLGNLDDILVKYRVSNNSVSSQKAKDMHIATLLCAFKGHLKYGYPITFKTKVITLVRLFIAYFVPYSIWRYISSILKK